MVGAIVVKLALILCFACNIHAFVLTPAALNLGRPAVPSSSCPLCSSPDPSNLESTVSVVTSKITDALSPSFIKVTGADDDPNG